MYTIDWKKKNVARRNNGNIFAIIEMAVILCGNI